MPDLSAAQILAGAGRCRLQIGRSDHTAMKPCASLLLLAGLVLAAFSEKAGEDPGALTLAARSNFPVQHIKFPDHVALHEEGVRVRRSPKRLRFWGRFKKKRPNRPRRRTRRPLPDPPTLPPYLRGMGRKKI
ncbi:uncharacterized protein [Periplaneta americana]|uniref:uncharacterized protein n=1 Tax=Periplaneta americana TaxID=6978 RepID=UPI0037E6FA25